MAVKHGGSLLSIARKYNSEPSEWLDLSTGVSPFSYPLSAPPIDSWNRLPEDDDGLETAAMEYYGTSTKPIAVAGSQAAIMALPAAITRKLGQCGVIALPKVGYKEHQQAWQSFRSSDPDFACGQSWKIEFYSDFPTQEQIERCDVVLVINPNNPTAIAHDKQLLCSLQHRLQQKNAYLIVDEAFSDSYDMLSLLDADTSFVNSVVLRSVGKFFGLAGARVGFLYADDEIKYLVQDYLGPWTIAGPSRWALKQALSDTQWQENNRIRLQQNAKRLFALLSQYFFQKGFSQGELSQKSLSQIDLSEKNLPHKVSGTDLFMTVYLSDAEVCHHILCERKVLTRLCDEKNAIRFGLPATQSQWKHLETALEVLQQERLSNELIS